MAENNKKISIFFLEALKQDLEKLAETKGKLLSRKDLNDILIFDLADDEEKNVIHEMVSEIALEDTKLNTGQNGSGEATANNQVSSEANGSDMGKSKRYASSHFQSDKEAA